MEVSVEDFNPDGRGRARLDGRAVLVSQAYPGERVAVLEDRRSRGAVEGRVERLLHSPPGVRASHPCPHEFRCTGCPLLALDESLEAEWKSARVREILARLGCEAVPFAFTRPGPLFGYRRFGKALFARWDGRVRWGSYVQSTHGFSDNTGCPVLHPSVSAILDACAEEASGLGISVDYGEGRGLKHATARTSAATGQALITLTATGDDDGRIPALCRAMRTRIPALAGVSCIRGAPEDNVLLRGERIHVEGSPEIVEDILGFSHRIGSATFFQINPPAAERLFEAAVALVPAGVPVLEGYSGVGALTLPLLRRCGRVHAIEANPESHRILASRATAGLTAENAPVEAVLAARLREGPFAACVMDPPRRGLGPAAAVLSELGPAVLVTLHCSPAAFERDAAILLAGGYRISEVCAVDQFPRTAHVEVLARFDRSRELLR